MEKLCKYCNKYYPDLDFGVALSTEKKVYRRLKCRFCYNNAKQLVRDKYQKWINDYKRKFGCHWCGIKDERVLEFHHTNPKNKEFSIGHANYNHFGLDRIKKEIEKCAVICANCHRIIHYKTNWKHNG